MSLTEWLTFHYGKERFHPGLERMTKALTPLLPDLRKIKTVTIAGTNGKGETTLWLSHFLRHESHLVWTSPHITSITERFRSQNGQIEENKLKSLIEFCHQEVNSRKLELTYYEFLFFVFCTWATEVKPEFILLEVGLGGRMDAVNVLDAELVLLPSISRDHQEYLGNRYDLILREKLGVLRSRAKLLSFMDLKYLRERAQTYAASVGASFIDLEDHYPVPSCHFSSRNQTLARAAYRQLTSKEALIDDSSPLTMSDRGEIVRRRGEWLLYGSHNIDGMRKLIQFLHSGNYNLSENRPAPAFDAIVVAFSQRDAEDIRLMLKMLRSSQLGDIKVTSFEHPKAASAELVQDLASQEGLEFVKDINSFVQGRNTGRYLVAGSYYFLGVLKSLLGHR